MSAVLKRHHMVSLLELILSFVNKYETRLLLKQVLAVTADLRILDQRKRFLLKDKASKPKTYCEKQLEANC